MVTVEGAMGAGKSTVMRHLACCAGVVVVGEPEDIICELLPQVATNQLDAGTFQIAVACGLFAKQRKGLASIAGTDSVLVTERSMGSNRHVFAESTLDPHSAAMSAYTMSWGALTEELRMPPAVHIYLRCDAATLLARVRKRNRRGEQTVTMEYMQTIIDAHERWLDSCTGVYVVDASQEASVVAARVGSIIMGMRSR